MKIFYFFIFLFLFSCSGYIDSRKNIEVIFNIEPQKDKVRYHFVLDRYENFPFTIYARVQIDSSEFINNIVNVYPTCDYMSKENIKFQSFHVENSNYNNFSHDDIPPWFDVKDTKADFVCVFNVFTYKANCEDYNVQLLFKYKDGYCYLIIDSIG